MKTPPRSAASSVLVTGCAGFIGSNVTELLLSQGLRVVGIDNMNDAYDPRLKEWRLQKLRRHRALEFHRIDLTNAPDLHGVFEKSAPFSSVIHLAARAGVRQSVENPWVYVDTNLTGTLNLLEICRQRDVNKLVLASTSSLYGGTNPVPFREDADTNAPLSPYAASKKAAEGFCYTYHALYGLDVTIVRYFTVYGPAGRPDMSLFRFVQRISEGRPITVFGDGRQSRDFTHVDDIARGTCAALRPLGFEIVNLGSDRPVVLAEAISMIEVLVGHKAEIQRQALHPADVPATWADVGKARRLLGWQPMVSFREGLSRLVSWYRENRSWAGQLVTQ
jgi:UDP-glucuronate 4-epimerase